MNKFNSFRAKFVFLFRSKILFFLALTIPFLFLNTQVNAEKKTEAPVPEVQIEAKQIDPRAKILSEYLAKFDSPLQYHAQDFIDAAKTYNLDWRMLPAIAGVESTFGKQIPGGFNAWGWGVYGTQAIYFNSWREAIFTIAQGLRENYLNKGLTNPYSINTVYAASPYWGGKVSFFMQDLENFAGNFNPDSQTPVKINTYSKIAAVSGQLVSK